MDNQNPDALLFYSLFSIKLQPTALALDVFLDTLSCLSLYNIHYTLYRLYRSFAASGEYRSRTDDLLNANQAL